MSDQHELPEHAARNRAHWDELAAGYVAAGERSWESDASWGIWDIPESELGLLDGVDGMDAIELGCGTAYVSAWLARRGARPVGIDNSPQQLETAAPAAAASTGSTSRCCSATRSTSPTRTRRFDLAISEYGACLWADPYAWVPEAARLLRPGGRLVFLTNGYVLMLCAPDEEGVAADERLLRPSFGMHRFEWPDDDSRRVPPRPRRLDPAAAGERLRGPGPDRAAGAGRCVDDRRRLRDRRLGPAVAQRGGLGRPQARVIARPFRRT